jgi:peptide/nickel transport system substrate-binding protein
MALGLATVLTLAACTGTSPSPSTPGESDGASAAPSEGVPTGGTIYILTLADQIDQIDPQRVYTGEDLAFFGSTIYRSLLVFKVSADPLEGTTLEPDLATDTGTSSDAGKTWSFTLRDGPTWQDGSDVTCEDVKYGVSRTFATSIINQGPTYQIQYLDIPSVEGFTKDADGKVSKASASAYGGPYSDNLTIFSDAAATTLTPNDKAAYDAAVVCDGKKITFHLAKPVGDFNYATTLGMFPVPNPVDHPGVDTGETYAVAAPPMSNGPYKIDSYTTGNGGKLIMSRNTNWSQASDPYRHAYPDVFEYDFGIPGPLIDQRIIQSSGNDQTAVGGALQPENLAVVYKDASTPQDQFKGRAFSSFDPYTRYLWINVTKVPNVKIRQAIAVALDRSAMKKNLGGDFYGEYADGAVKPTIGADYAATGLWDGLLGQTIPETGDPDFAKQLIEDSGVPAPSITFDYPQTPTQDRQAAIIVSSLARAGITVTPNPIEAGQYYSVVFYTAKGHEFGYGGWGADWPNASTVVAPLFTVKGGWDLSFLDDAGFNAKVDAALAETDRAKQVTLWQALNKEAAEQMYLIPTFFGLTQRIAGTRIGAATDPDGVYLWSAWGSWPYLDLYVKP